MGNTKDLIAVAIEFGTDKIAVAYGAPDEANKPTMLAFASLPSNGCVQKGEIVDFAMAENILGKTLAKANEQCPDVRYYCKQVSFLVNGRSVVSKRSCGTLTLDEQKEVTEQQWEYAKDKVEAEPIEHLKQFNTFYSFSTLDDSIRVSSPVGHTAQKIAVYSQVLYTNEKMLSDMGSMLKSVGFDYCDDIRPSYCGAATAMSVMTEEEGNSGVLVIDFGRGSCNYILVNGDGVYACGNVPVGTDHIANDLSLGLNLKFDYCKKFIDEHNLSKMNQAKENALRVGTRQVMLSTLETIIDARIRETFQIIYNQLREKNVLSHFTNGVVLTGGGAELDHVNLIATEVFKSRVRIGTTIGINNLPEEITSAPTRYTALTGLLKISCDDLIQSDGDGNKFTGFISTLTDGVIDKFISCFKRKKQSE